MDEETRAALADLKQSIANLAAGLALVARHQTIQGERISRILDILAPEGEAEEEPQRPTTQELLGQMMAANAKAVRDLTAQLNDLGEAVDGVPRQTVVTMGQAFSLPPRQLK